VAVEELKKKWKLRCITLHKMLIKISVGMKQLQLTEISILGNILSHITVEIFLL